MLGRAPVRQCSMSEEERDNCHGTGHENIRGVRADLLSRLFSNELQQLDVIHDGNTPPARLLERGPRTRFDLMRQLRVLSSWVGQVFCDEFAQSQAFV